MSPSAYVPARGKIGKVPYQEERRCRAKRGRKISVPRSEKAKERDDAARSAAENVGAFPQEKVTVKKE